MHKAKRAKEITSVRSYRLASPKHLFSHFCAHEIFHLKAITREIAQKDKIVESRTVI